jgi:hypothetical protein
MFRHGFPEPLAMLQKHLPFKGIGPFLFRGFDAEIKSMALASLYENLIRVYGGTLFA